MILQHYQDNVLEDPQQDNSDGLSGCGINSPWNTSAGTSGFRTWDDRCYGFVPKGFVLDTKKLFKDK